MKKTKFVNLTIFVNWMPLWSLRFTQGEAVSHSKGDRGDYIITLVKKLPVDGKDIVARYEELFSDENYPTLPNEQTNPNETLKLP